MSKVPMTVEGEQRLKVELQRLKTVERPAVIQAIAEARSHGDLSENADYDAAKERQGFIEGRISDIESKLANAQVIDPSELDVPHVSANAELCRHHPVRPSHQDDAAGRHRACPRRYRESRNE